jgi:RHS repeat-associated protein
MQTTDYSGNFVYKDKQTNYILFSEGRLIRVQDGTYYPEYFIKDHLGDVRAVVSSVSGITQVTDYYPFGLEIHVSGSSNNQLKYNTKELQTEAGLGWYDYGARFYDPQIARWHVVDPMAEKSRRWSPYSYCMDNPIRFIDPDGQSIAVAGQDKVFRREIRRELQKLSNDKIKIDKHGVVSFRERNRERKEFGTSTIRQLVKSNNNHIISKTDERNGTIAQGGNNNPNISNGIGTGSNIKINPDLKVNVVVENGSVSKASSQIVVGHELLHASHIDVGKVETGQADPNGSNYDPDIGGGGEPLSNEEINTREEENVLRKEQGVKEMRADPVEKDSGITLPEVPIK